MKSDKWMWVCLCIPVYFLIESTTGVTVTLTGSADYAVLDQTFRFTCTVTDEDAPTTGSVSFSRDGFAIVCLVIPSACSQIGGITGYSCGCVSGQRDVYYMDISSVSLQKDEGTWRCQRRSSDSNNITLPVYYGPFNNLTLDKSSPQRVTEFCNLIVVCSSTCKPCSYTWRRGTVTVSNTKTLSLTNINRNQAGDYICVAANTKTGSIATSSLTVNVEPLTTDRFGKGIGIGVAITLPIILGLVVALAVTLKKLREKNMGQSQVTGNQMRIAELNVDVRSTYTNLSREPASGNEYEQLQTPVQFEGSSGGHQDVSADII